MAYSFTLTPQDNTGLQLLCGPCESHLQLIEKEFNIQLLRQGFSFSLQLKQTSDTSETILSSIAQLLQELYAQCYSAADSLKEGNVHLLDLEDIHLAIQELKMQIQQASLSQEALLQPSQPSSPYSAAIKTKRGLIKPRGKNQIQYLNNIRQYDISFGIGPAGTGKTFLAVAAAIEALEHQQIKRILLTRPAVEAGEKLGFLPGDLGQKIEPYLRPLYDALFEMLGFERVQKLMERNVIEIAPLAYMRGRTLNDSFIILDESQNTTIEQMKMFLTRIGFNSKAVITGDITQVDLPRNMKSGLKHAVDVLKEVEELSFNHFESDDIVRHPVVAKVVNAYDKWEKNEEIRRNQLMEERKAQKERLDMPTNENTSSTEIKG